MGPVPSHRFASPRPSPRLAVVRENAPGTSFYFLAEGEAKVTVKGRMIALIGRMNEADDGTMVVPSEYLEVVIVKK